MPMVTHGASVLFCSSRFYTYSVCKLDIEGSDMLLAGECLLFVDECSRRADAQIYSIIPI